jgi:hypothetical protein
METLLTLLAPALPFCCAANESAALVLLAMAICGLLGLACTADAPCGDIDPPPQAANPIASAAGSNTPTL